MSLITDRKNHQGEPESESSRRILGAQEDQDREDEEKLRKAMKDLTQSWMDRLQLISLITTFFASTEAGLLQVAPPDSTVLQSKIEEVTNAAIMGALIFHVNAAILAFLAAFFLVTYKVHIATGEERQAVKDVNPSFNEVPRRVINRTSENTIWSANPHLVQTGPFRGEPPFHLLRKCYVISVLLSALGFILASAGIVCLVWSRYPTSVSIFTSCCMGVCLVLFSTMHFLPEMGGYEIVM
ncbi:hypothetical protein BD779DRAFT_1513371 [Infundibulicybe gibba]|nr:hypothetical protein BD779DRAFT_1513371 [Infundibulicybe gibba]